MKKQIILLMIISLSIFFIGQTQAHSPASIEIEYNFDTDILTVRVNHIVSDPDTHYINQIDVWVNDVFNTTETYSRQFETTFQIDTFNITANQGDVIKIKAFCNVSGSLIDEFTLQDPAIPEFGILLPLFVFIIPGAFLGWRLHKKHTERN
ncbi:MAG: hypothetical protein GOP50_01160 [Candidatus Heimdallarchaeota archaeon]|nr:hypothetical protein [Candidatus Heimdallarchaeota archaeon]